ncbi:MAG: 3-hydroxyacyl-ACP dehydratase FabZ [Syntrophomonadaceae bacterium]
MIPILTIKQIMEILPHRYPFLMVDKILEINPGKNAVGIKNLSANEPYFNGHFPGNPVMPGVLMAEAIAQVGACALLSEDKYRDYLVYLAGIENMRFRRTATPGDTLLIKTELLNIKGNIGKGRGEILIDNNTLCKGEFWFSLNRLEGK